MAGEPRRFYVVPTLEDYLAYIGRPALRADEHSPKDGKECPPMVANDQAGCQPKTESWAVGGKKFGLWWGRCIGN